MKNYYNKQTDLIESLAKLIIEKSKRFAKKHEQNQNFDDLSYVIAQLKEANRFMGAL